MIENRLCEKRQNGCCAITMVPRLWSEQCSNMAGGACCNSNGSDIAPVSLTHMLCQCTVKYSENRVTWSDGMQLAGCIRAYAYSLAGFIPCSQRPSLTSLRSQKTSAKQMVPKSLFRQRLWHSFSLRHMKSSCCLPFECSLLVGNRHTRPTIRYL